jgi:hypothetical protein
MQLSRWIALLFLCLATACAVATEDNPGDQGKKETKLTDAEFNKLLQELQMPKTGLWAIPWKISIREARELAVKTGKPIHLWAQDGHPLGVC